jgi:uncharacterized membrane protein HdeD (DUF308 family)
LFGIILLIAATTGIVSLARTRGGNPWIWGILTLLGYFLVPYGIVYLAVAAHLFPTPAAEDAQLLSFVASIAWVALIAFCARFLLGRAHAKPDGMWSCQHCRYLNQPYAVICEACRQPYGSKPQPAASN